jgi:hypothetical protein
VIKANSMNSFMFYTKISKKIAKIFFVSVRDGHGGGWSRKINAWHLYTLMVYL